MNSRLSTLIDIDWHPSPRKVRQFAACAAVFLVVIASYAGGMSNWLWGGIIGGAVILGSWLKPAVIRPVYVAMMLVTLPIGMVLGEVALLSIFLLVFLPIGLMFRLLKRDALKRTIDRSAVSYWETCDGQPAKRSYLRRY